MVAAVLCLYNAHAQMKHDSEYIRDYRPALHQIIPKCSVVYTHKKHDLISGFT